jgi:SprT protein
MAYVKHPLDALRQFLPDDSFEHIVHYLTDYKVKMTVTQGRKSILGQFKYDNRTGQNSISVNGDLQAYNFLLTLAHEVAHCICFNKYKKTVLPHGKEWQVINGQVLNELIDAQIFPDDIVAVLKKNLYSQRASCGDLELEKVLMKYDTTQSHLSTVSQLSIGQKFLTPDGGQFLVKEKRRTRYLCIDINTNKEYLFPASYKVSTLE